MTGTLFGAVQLSDKLQAEAVVWLLDVQAVLGTLLGVVQLLDKLRAEAEVWLLGVAGCPALASIVSQTMGVASAETGGSCTHRHLS